MAKGNGRMVVVDETERDEIKASGKKGFKVLVGERGYIEIPIVGVAPYIPHCHSKEDLDRMEKERMGIPVESTKNTKLDPFKKAFECLYILPGCEERAAKLPRLNTGESWAPVKYFGIPAVAFKSAMIRASSSMGFKMVEVKTNFFIKGISGHWTGRDLVPIEKCGKIVMRRDPKALRSGGMDLRYRFEIREWKTTLRVTYNKNAKLTGGKLSGDVMMTIAHKAGFAGVGDERPSTKTAAGMEMGIFNVEI